MIIRYEGVEPKFHPSVWVAPSATVSGDVEMAEDSSVWFGAVIRGDINTVRIGKRTSIQDLCVIHVTLARFGTFIGDDVTVGHRALLHGCTIGNRCLVGMGCIILDGVEIGDECMVAAGSIVTPGTVVPPRTVVMGAPAKPKREITPQELKGFHAGVMEYVHLARTYAAIMNANPFTEKQAGKDTQDG